METATSIELFVEILDRYVYYFDQGNESVSRTVLDTRNPRSPMFLTGVHYYLVARIDIMLMAQVTTKYVNGLIELIHSNLAGSQGDGALVEQSRKHFNQTLENIRARAFEGVVLYPS